MKKLIPLVAFTLVALFANAQVCTPVNCISSLPAYGGICDTMLASGRVNQSYSDFESFVLTSTCFDAGLIDPSQAGNSIKITMVDNFTYTGMPTGISGATNANSYSPPNNGNVAGCVRFQGIPTQVGVFKSTVNFLADVRLCTFPYIAINNNAAGYGLRMTILPDPTFTGLAATYCTTDAPVALTVTGTTGGTFSGQGVSGTTFDPATAGVGTWTVKYKVTKQEGAAIAPATDSMMVTVTVVAPSFTYYVDSDGDGYGQTANTILSCASSAPAGYAAQGGDCNDNNANINPSKPEICNGIDDNCNTQSDEGLALYTYYYDGDNDGYGNADNSIVSCQVLAPATYVANNGDCDDSDADINPGAVEIPNNAVDENCDGNLGVVDTDNDGFDSSVDCNDNNNTIYPGAPELCDGLDNDCDGFIDLADLNSGLTTYTYYVDSDNDGYGSVSSITSCANTAPAGYANNNTDCDDANSAIHPGATEVCDGIDNNCSGSADEGLALNIYYADADNDGYGNAAVTVSTCSGTAPVGYVINDEDCDDGDPGRNPDAIEVCDNIDNNCDGNVDEGLSLNTYYLDADADGYGITNTNVITCSVITPVGYVLVDGDCDDTDDAIYPGAPELCDGKDNDCANGIDDGLSQEIYYRDFDGDGYGDQTSTVTTCEQSAPTGYVSNFTDCNDANLDIHPGATEIPDNGIDEDCNGSDLLSGLTTVEAQFGIKMYPNPVKDYVVLSGKLTDNLVLTVYDLQGKQLLTRAMVQATNYVLDLSSLKAGYYMLEVTNKNNGQRGFNRIAVVK